MSAERVVYLDASAIVKLVVEEPESAALRRHLRRRRPLVSSALSRVEVGRAVLPQGAAAGHRARDVLARIDLVRVNDRVLDVAAALGPTELRSLDAVHLATASLLGATLAAVVTYDDRLGAAAGAMGWRVAAPS